MRYTNTASTMKNCFKSFSVFTLAALSANAGLIVGGNFNNVGDMRNSGGTFVTISDVNQGFVSTNDTKRTFNGGTVTNQGTNNYAGFLPNSTSGSAGTGFFLGTGVVATGGLSTPWSIFNTDADGNKVGQLTEISIDVAAFTSYLDNSLTTINGVPSDVNKPTNVTIAIYGFTGDAAALAASLSSDLVSVGPNKINDPAGYAGYTQLLSTTLNPLSTTGTALSPNWETQTFAIPAVTNYDYYLFGISGTNQVQGVGLDNIAVSFIPEPSTYIAGIGFLGLAYFVYRRRKKAAAQTVEAA